MTSADNTARAAARVRADLRLFESLPRFGQALLSGLRILAAATVSLVRKPVSTICHGSALRFCPVFPLVLLLLPSLTASPAGPPQAKLEHREVILLYSFGRDFGTYTEVAENFKIALTQTCPSPVEILEVSMAPLLSLPTPDDGPLLSYILSLAMREPRTLIVSIGGPAARFLIRNRATLLPVAKLLAGGVDDRWLGDLAGESGIDVVPIRYDGTAVVEESLGLLPETKRIVVVFGGSQLSRFWIAEFRSELSRLSNRVRVTWANEWSLEEMERRLADLPPQTIIFFGELWVDAAGIPFPGYTALKRLHEAANAPIFGLHSGQLGMGIVGGRLLSESEVGRRIAAAALRVMDGEALRAQDTAPVVPGNPTFDFRELERWGIRESLLPPGSSILFRPPSLWERYGIPLVIVSVIIGLQAALIGSLIIQVRHRRETEGGFRALSRRLLAAHEDERGRLARELHDDFTQRLARLAIDTALLERALDSPTLAGSAATIRDGLIHLSEDVHALSYRLHPSTLDLLGLEEALKWECIHFSRTHSIEAKIASFEAPSKLPDEIGICIFRIAQESLRNVARHSQASSVVLSVEQTGDTLHLTVRDNGMGFDSGDLRSRPTLGIASMRERTELVRGTFEIVSARGQGTTVIVSVPLKGIAV